ncbi:zf-HC2 domain-containing protein [Mucilaginibacter defluvii]|uniref:Zinc finger protein n=1 Tax=Mucilaginibacter defluvii TaxID=1196019 RepID=A0ABP9FPT4_9SPHI
MKTQFRSELVRIAYNCRKATFLIEKKQETALSGREKLELKFHLAGCSICRIYQQQSILINNMMHRLFKDIPVEIRLDGDFKTSLQQKINERLISDN